MTRRVCYILIAIILPLLCLGLPILRSEVFGAWAGGTADATSSASVIIEQPSGKCTVLINRSRHTDEDTLAVWRDFFEGKEIPILFEDIVCAVPSEDQTGQEIAESFQSRLPEHQMEIVYEDATLLLSKAEYGRCDVLLISNEMAEAYGVGALFADERYEVIHVGR